MRVKLAIVSLLIASLVGCSSNDKKELKEAPLIKFSATAKACKNWSATIGSGRDKRYSKLVPAVFSDRVYASDVEGNVYALNLDSGKRVWKSRLKEAISASTGVNSHSVFVGTFSGELIALSADNGEEKWRVSVSSEILAVPAANERVVVAQTIDGRAFAFDAYSGEALWRYDHTVPSLTLRGTANPVIYRNQVLLAFGNGQLVSLQLSDGALKWDARLSQPKGRTELEKMIDIDATPFFSGGLIYAANYQGAIAAYSAAQGQAVWKQDLSTYQDLSVANGKVYAVTEESAVIAFNAGSGVQDWMNDQMLRRMLGAPAAYGDYVLTLDYEGYMHVLSADDGSFAARFKPAGDDFTSAIVVSDSAFLVLSDDGRLSSYTLQTLN